MKTCCLFILLVFFNTISIAQNKPGIQSFLLFEENYRLHPSDVTQTEVFIVNSPLDQNILFTTCNTLTFIPFFISEGIYVSVDGGNNWHGNDTCTGTPIPFHGGDPGIVIDKNGTFIITRLGRSPFVGLYSHYSNDNGITWSSQKVISTDDLERASLESDANPSSPYYGRTYAVWVKFALPFPLMLSYTDNGAQSWTMPLPINNPANRSAGGDIAMGPDGKVYVCWAGVTESSPFKEILVGFASSLNWGLDWNVTENAFDVNGITGILENKANIRVNGLPNIAVDLTDGPKHGWIYIVSGQKDLAPAGSDPDIILNRSEDGGLTWSAGIRVNQDGVNNGKTQYFPSIHVDKFGAINIIFYDDRNTSPDSAGVFLARSTNGGDSWTEWEISDHNFKPIPIGGLGQGYQGDNIDLTSTDSHLWPVWMDNSTGTYQVWTSPVSFSVINSVEEPTDPRTESGIIKIYPNPFTHKTKIGYQILERGIVSLKVYNVFGVEITEILNEMTSQGYHEVDFEGVRENGIQPLKSGLYFCCLTSNGLSDTKRMIIIDH